MFVNDRKEPGSQQPDRTGYVIAHRDIAAGERIQLVGWIKKTDSGHILSLRASDPRGQQQAQPKPRRDESEPW